jgi:ribosomal-protein-alanine N-acetyltransferase
MQHTTLETATPQNIEEMLKIERECFTAEAYTRWQILDLLESKNALALLTRVNGDASGFIIALLETEGKHTLGHVVTIDVAVKYRRKGLGSFLLRKMEDLLSERGVDGVCLEVRVDNRAALRLYQKQGYVEVQLLERYYSLSTHGLRLAKRLQPKENASS